MSEKQTSKDEFMKNYEEQAKDEVGLAPSGEYEERDTLKAERDTVYSGYFLESYQGEIKGNYGMNTAVHLTSPDGDKLTLWVNNWEEQHFLGFVSKLEEKGTELPVKIDFLRTKEASQKSDREYNKLRIMLTASGDEVKFELESL